MIPKFNFLIERETVDLYKKFLLKSFVMKILK